MTQRTPPPSAPANSLNTPGKTQASSKAPVADGMALTPSPAAAWPAPARAGEEPAKHLPRPAFPPAQLPRIGGGTQGNVPRALPKAPSMPQPQPRPASTPSGRLPPVVRPGAPQIRAFSPSATAPRETEPCALPLPRNDEPLTHNGHSRPAIKPLSQATPLPRSRSLTKPGTSLLGAINSWLRNTGQKLAASFMVKKKRPAQPSAASLRERTELTQLRAENRRLRDQLEGLAATRVDKREMSD